MPFGFDSVYGNGGQNASYTARFGGDGGDGGGGGGSLNAQMRAMTKFDPAAFLNVAQQNAWQRDEDLFRRGQTVRRQDRQYDEEQAREARNQASQDRVRAERQARMEQSRGQAFQQSPQARYRAWQKEFEGGQTAAQKATNMIGGMQSTAYGDLTNQLAALAAAGIPIGKYTGFSELAAAGADASAAAEAGATQLKLQKRSQDYSDKNRSR